MLSAEGRGRELAVGSWQWAGKRERVLSAEGRRERVGSGQGRGREC